MIDRNKLIEFWKAARKASNETQCIEAWINYGYEDMEKWIEMRTKCQTDLFWFSTEILGYDLVEAHRLIVDDFFLKKDPNIPVYQLSDKKSRLILYPRGSFKSSLDEADTVQWIICYPNIRVGLMTATEDLGLAFVRNVKGFFQIPESTALTHFQMLFFEHCVKANQKQDAAIFMTRARTKKLAQATLEALSLVGTTSGFHYDVGKFDDVVSNRNSGANSTSESRKTVYQNIRMAAALIDPPGYKFYIGTPYDEDDAWSVVEDKVRDLVVLKAPALTIKDHAKGKQFLDLVDEDVDLLFPVDRQGVPRLTLKFLQDEFAADEYIFSCNYMLDPSRVRTVKFTEELLRSRITQEAGLPQPGTYRLFAAWDFADSTGRQSDYSVGVVGMIDVFGRLYIVELVRGKFAPSELAYQVAALASRWKVERIHIEKSPGADFLQNDIMRELTRVGYGECPIPEWFPVDNQKGAKAKRAEMLESYLNRGVLWLSTNMGYMDDVIHEFTNFKPDSKRKDDIVDAIAHLARVIPAKVQLPETQQEQNNIVFEILARKQLQDMYFGVREAVPAQPVEDVPLTMFDGQPILCPHCGCSPCLGA